MDENNVLMNETSVMNFKKAENGEGYLLERVEDGVQEENRQLKAELRRLMD